MSGKRYADEFKIEAARPVTVRGHKVADVAQRLGITTHGPTPSSSGAPSKRFCSTTEVGPTPVVCAARRGV